MTTRPRIATDATWARGVAAGALFAVFAAVFLTADIGAAAGFPDVSFVEAIGFALFDLDAEIPSEGFLVAFLLIAVVLDAALDGALMLAKRDEETDDGGEP